MSEKVKECPFCGRLPSIQKWHGGGPNKHLVYCDCQVGPSVTGGTRARAIRLWNTRKSTLATEHDLLRKAKRVAMMEALDASHRGQEVGDDD